MLNTDLHTHSIASGHAINTVYEMAKEAKNRGVALLGIIEHGPSMQGAPHKGYFWVSEQIEELYGIRIVLGIEANILNESGDIDLGDKLLMKQKVVMAGLHSHTPYENSKSDNTKSIVEAMNNPYIKIISHPYRFKFPVDVEEIVVAACKTNTLLELNNQVFGNESENSLFLESYRKMVSLCKKYGHPMIIGSDAHIATKIGNDGNIKKHWSYLGLSDEMIVNNYPENLREWIQGI